MQSVCVCDVQEKNAVRYIVKIGKVGKCAHQRCVGTSVTMFSTQKLNKETILCLCFSDFFRLALDVARLEM